MNTRSTILAGIISLIVPAATAPAQESPLPPQLPQAVEQWRSTQLPAGDPETYWITLKALGERIDEATAERIMAADASDVHSAIALMAQHVALAPEKAQELADWYGVHRALVSRELRGIDDDEVWRMTQQILSSGRAAIEIEPLRAEHMHPDYLPFWQAWLLAPPVEPTTRHMRRNIETALSELGDDRTIALLVQKCDQLHDELSRHLDGAPLQQRLYRDSGQLHNIIREIGGTRAVLGLLDLMRIAKRDGYLVAEQATALSLASRLNPVKMREHNPDYFEDHRLPGKALDDPTVLPPYDDKWTGFKPVIEELLQQPELLEPGDAEILREALAIMPGAD